MATHELKTWPIFFREVWLGNKTAELRENDRGFQVADLLVLREWDPELAGHPAGHVDDEIRYTGREIRARVTHIVNCAHWFRVVGQMHPVVMSLRVEERNE